MSDAQPQLPIKDISEEAQRILREAHKDGIQLRLLGGLAIYLNCPSTHSDERLQRSYGDMDFATLSTWNAKTKALFSRLGYTPNKAFNNLHGYQRLLFHDELHDRKIDIFIDRMQMCHTLDFRSRLHLHPHTLSPADLLMTKLQIVEINEKDIKDAIALLCDYDIVDGDHGVHGHYIAGLVAQDWGMHRTFELNLKRIQEFASEHHFPESVQQRIDTLLKLMEAHPKTMKWKARAVVGERVRWYELPEEGR